MSRTLVKSAPELWAEVSDPAALARHLGEFGEIRITRVERECSVAWEGEAASGTVELEPAGWGTRVKVTARTGTADAPAPTPPPPLAPEPATPPPDPPRRGFWARLLRRPAPPPEPAPAPSTPPAPAVAPGDRGAMAVLFAMLDTLGSANHRPFSRD